MAISRAQLLKELLPGLNALFGLEYAKYGEEHKEIYETESSERSFEEETKLSGFSAAPVKNEGAAIAYDNAQEAYTARYTHETIAMGFSITEEAVEDNLYDSLSSRYTKALARGMAYTKQVKAASILNTGFAGGPTYGDGVTLFSTAHPLISGGVNSNRPTTGADLNETSLENAVIQIAGWTDERGLLIAAKPKKLVVPPALMFVATRLLETELRVGTGGDCLRRVTSVGVAGIQSHGSVLTNSGAGQGSHGRARRHNSNCEQSSWIINHVGHSVSQSRSGSVLRLHGLTGRVGVLDANAHTNSLRCSSATSNHFAFAGSQQFNEVAIKHCA